MCACARRAVYSRYALLPMCADGIQTDLYIDTYARIFICMPDIYGLVALLDSTIKLL